MSFSRRFNRRKKEAVPPVPPKSRAELEALHGEVWSTEELARTFVVTAMIGSSLVVRRKNDDCVGTLEVQAGPPQIFYNFKPQFADQ